MASVVPGDRGGQTEEDKHEGRSRSPGRGARDLLDFNSFASKYLCVLG